MPDNDIDLSFLVEIADGSDEFIVESIGMFLEQTPDLLQLINTSISNRDWPAAASSAHKIKSNLGFFGMLISQALIQDVEKLCKAGGESPEDIIMLFSEANSIINANMVQLKKIKAEKAASL